MEAFEIDILNQERREAEILSNYEYFLYSYNIENLQTELQDLRIQLIDKAARPEFNTLYTKYLELSDIIEDIYILAEQQNFEELLYEDLDRPQCES